ncbi:MAG TPA: adenosylcobalamin-dependent ribonucleoside-diphosphate reductase [Acidimicrobiia bacterium]|nr:adenosylcobalamin-dependent ribonucleoside-diphosphate reductase [Acidimicrobiia bacterium]
MAPDQVGIGIQRHFTRAGEHPYDTVEWERRDARIPNYKSGGDAFFQPGVEFPVTWSQNATNIVAQKYFRGQLGTPERESSLKQVIDRVSDTIADWGVRDGYFVDEAEAEAFRDELKYLLLHQRAAFNSPVWFNIGVKGVPAQASACFILAVEDTMNAILNWYVEEGTIFKGGSGSGINLSNIRSSMEPLKGGGTASGPVSFMRGADASAGTIKCLHADTDVVTDHGVVPIRAVAPGWKVLTRHGMKTVLEVHDNGIRSLVKVRTGLGDEILCTPEHKFRVRGAEGEVWREAGRLRPDDYVMVDLAQTDYGTLQRLEAEEPTGVGEAPLPSVLDEAFAVWLGWAHGEGRLKPLNGSGALNVHLDGEDKGLVERYRNFTQSVLGQEAAPRTVRGGDAPPATVCPPRVARFLQVNGLWRHGSQTIPRVVRSSPAAVRAAFLAGLFESDGHVQHGIPTLWSKRRNLALEAHRLLLSIGIPSKITQAVPPAPPRGRGTGAAAGSDPAELAGAAPTSGPDGLYRVRIVGEEGVRRFAKLVGFVSEGKARLLEAALRRPAGFEANWFFPHVDQELDRIGFSKPALRSAICAYRHDANPYGMSLARAASVQEAFPAELDGPLARFAHGDEIYVPVTVDADEDDVTYDLTIEDVHEYLVHNAVTHNSGGKTRRAAKMVILNVDHPDIETFIDCKKMEERKARALAAAGFDMDLDGADSHSIQYQNANNSVRVTDDFMEAVVNDRDWQLKAVTSGEPLKTVRARKILRQISEAAWECADPGMQFDTTINRWHTASNTGRINASNPCSEYMHLDNSACNLASLNLLKFLQDDGSFDVEGFKAAVEVVFTAQEILVGNADYPTRKIGENTRRFRQLGLGYANLGALLMAQGLPYDSEAGRAWAAGITALMTGHAYATSARTAGRMGPFAGYAENREPTLKVLRMHRSEVNAVDADLVPENILTAAHQAWDEAVELGEVHGVRNSQASVLAPTGTIGLMMDCDTTGIEPDLALTKAKKLVGGGTMFIVNQTVPRALRRLGYSAEQVEKIVAYIDEHKTILGAPGLRVDDLPVFACAMGDNSIHYMGHVKMMAAVQPFISGAISKCVVGETLVSTGDGLVRIGSLYQGERPDSFRDEVIEVASLDGVRKTDAFYYGGVRPVREVVLRSGHKVVGTPNHRLLVAGKDGLVWRRLDEIAEGESVALRYGAELWSLLPAHLEGFEAGEVADAWQVPGDMSAELAFLLGAFAATGRVSESTATVTISHPAPAVLDRLAGAWRTLFGLEARVITSEGRNSQVAVTSETAVAFLAFVAGTPGVRGVPGKDLAAYRRIPAAVLSSPRDMVLAYLQGLLSGAGVSRTAGAAAVTVGLGSATLLDDLQSVLTNLGVVHRRLDSEVVITGDAARDLFDLVPPADPQVLAQAADVFAGKDLPGSAGDFVPNLSPRELFLLIPTEQREEWTFLRDAKFRHVTRTTLDAVAAIPGVALPDWLAVIVADGLHFSAVERVASAGEREVYDLSVPVTHAFVGNGIVNHNTINMPEEVTVEDVEDLHIEAWRLGLKAIAIYRDNCKVGQPLSVQKSGSASAPVETKVERVVETIILQEPVRQKLPRRRNSKTFSFRVADCHGYVIVGEFEDGRPGEIFLKVAKQGSTLAGIMDAFAISVSHGLQYGVPLKAFVEMFTNMRFEPAGITDDPDIRLASSLVDYIFRRLAVEYLPYEERVEMGILTVGERSQPTLPGVEEASTTQEKSVDLAPPEPDLSLDLTTPPAPEGPRAAAVPEGSRRTDAPYCYGCGMEMQRAGSCYVCSSCGTTSGCS